MGGWLEQTWNDATKEAGEIWDSCLGDGQSYLDDEAKDSFRGWAEKDDEDDDE